MLKESFFFLRSYKYEHFKRNFFCGTNVEGGVEDVAFPLGVLVFQVAWGARGSGAVPEQPACAGWRS